MGFGIYFSMESQRALWKQLDRTIYVINWLDKQGFKNVSPAASRSVRIRPRELEDEALN